MNQKKIIILILFGILAAGGFALTLSQKKPAMPIIEDTYHCPMHPAYTSDRPGTCPICNMSLVKKENIPTVASSAPHQHSKKPEQSSKKKDMYYCPMHPTYTSDRPGTCPICNMSLVRREDSPALQASAGPKTAEEICLMHNCPRFHDGQLCPMLVVSKSGEKITCPPGPPE